MNQTINRKMKHIFFVLVFTFLSVEVSAQQGFKLGIQGALPVGDFQDNLGIVIGVDAGYMYALGEKLDLGVAVGYVHGFPRKISYGKCTNRFTKYSVCAFGSFHAVMAL